MLSVEDMRSFATPGSNGHITGMGSLDEEISAMLQSSHTTLSQASLAGVMAPDIFTSHASPYPRGPGGGLARTSSVGLPNSASRPRPHPNSRNNLRPQSNQPWAHMTGDEKWMLDAKGEVLDMFDSSGFGMMNPPAAAAAAAPPPPVSGGLHRYHSAPSAFLQALADEAFSQLPPPPSANMFSEGGLSPITEVMDVERIGSGSSVNEFEQFLSPDSDFSRRASMSALQAKPDNAETFSSLFPALKSSTMLLRQKSLPEAQQLKAQKQDPVEQEQHSEESISGTSEDNSLVSGFIDTLTSWPSSPTTPGAAKRPRGGDTAAAAAPAWDQSEITSNTSSGGLIRHMSLPTEGENLVQMRARAKRGCATHPRSIAERVRRTRISERMKKLQDLVPNMEKTSNTSDMLDETVEYVKSLQLKVAELQDTVTQLKAQTTLQSTS